jgi:hypothetical protein
MLVELTQEEIGAILGHIDDSRHIEPEDKALIEKLEKALAEADATGGRR